MEIINARPEHFPQIYSLICELEEAPLDRAKLEAVYLRNLTDPGIHYLIALENGGAAGFASVHVQCLLHHGGKIAELQEIVVAESRRGQGLGSLLFSEAEKTARAAGCLQLEVCCNRKRTASHRFYERQGMAASHFKFTEALDGQEQT
ncbi:GNAT family N-acetyltransferase [Enterocloster lavalensis]|uniref:GNAT family N-acetyltransferase n=1 Tax=Enterocloster lavalensis TaxID=460384 RepID=UPI002A802532|nr:GNAT family N-acetyltransferase [Enterocloster lavalensis]